MNLPIKIKIANAPDQLERITGYLEQMRLYFLALNNPTASIGDIKKMLDDLDTSQFQLDCRALVQLSVAFASHLEMAKMLLDGQQLDKLDLLHITPIINDVSSSTGS